MEKNLPASARDVTETGPVPGWGIYPRGGHGNPLQYACLKNAKGSGAWQAVVRGVARVRHC